MDQHPPRLNSGRYRGDMYQPMADPQRERIYGLRLRSLTNGCTLDREFIHLCDVRIWRIPRAADRDHGGELVSVRSRLLRAE